MSVSLSVCPVSEAMSTYRFVSVFKGMHSFQIIDLTFKLSTFLMSYNCFQGDIIAINYNKKVYELNVQETKPADAVTIIECDMNVDFEAPPGYQVCFDVRTEYYFLEVKPL